MLDKDLAQQIVERAQKIPIYHKIGIEIQKLTLGSCIATVPHDRSYDGIFDSFHGGLLMTVADTIACFALMTQIGTEERLATTDMSIRFLAPCTTDVRAVAKLIKTGRTMCPVQVDLYDTNNRHIAVAQVCYIRLGKA